MTSNSVDCILKNISPLGNIHFFLMVLCILPGSSKSLCIYFFSFFKWVPPNIVPKNQPAFLTSWEVCFGDGRWDRMRFHVGYIYTFWGFHIPIYRLHILFLFFSYCDDNCVSPNKPLSGEFLRRRLFGEKWSFYMSLVMLLYSRTFILPYMLFLFSCYQQSIFH